MNDEINEQIAKIDRSLRIQNISISDRINIVENELCKVFNINSNYDYPDTEHLLLWGDVNIWYEENYGIKTTINNFIQEKPFFLQGDIYYVDIAQITNHCNISDCINLSEVVIQDLTEEEKKSLRKQFKIAKMQWESINDLQLVVDHRDESKKSNNDFRIPDELNNNIYLKKETIKLIRFAIEDLNLAIVTLKNTRNYQFVIFPASQAIEKLLKACLIEEQLPTSGKSSEELCQSFIHKYSHRILDIFPDLNYYLENTSTIEREIKKIPYANEMFKSPSKINPRPVKINPRYDVIEISSEQAVEVIDATLNVFELVSEKFSTPLQRVMHYPELEEGYKEYYDQLEDYD